MKQQKGPTADGNQAENPTPQAPGSRPMRNSTLKFYGLFVVFIGVLATSASLLGGAFGLGLISANGQLTLRNALFLRDAVFFFLLGVAALRYGGAIRQYSRRALVAWEWCAWVIVCCVLATTMAAIVLVNIGTEYLVFTVFYLLIATTASQVRRTNLGYFEYLAHFREATQTSRKK